MNEIVKETKRHLKKIAQDKRDAKDATDEYYFKIIEEGINFDDSLPKDLKRKILDFITDLREEHFDA